MDQAIEITCAGGDAGIDPPPEADLINQWHGLLKDYYETSCAIDRELVARHDIGITDFEVLDILLDVLAESGGAEVPMRDLSDRMYLSQSGLSRSVARLDKRGLVVRRMQGSDRRAVSIAITAAGREIHAAAHPTRSEVLGRYLGQGQR